MARRVSSSNEILDRPSGNRTNWKDVYVDLKPTDFNPKSGKTEKVKRLRLIGLPIIYVEHNNRKQGLDANDPKKWVQTPFPDGDVNRSFTRICTEDDPDYGACPWCKLGFQPRTVYAINCIDRDDQKVKILQKGSTIFKEFAKVEKSNAELNEEALKEEPDLDAESLLWTYAGGPGAQDFRLKAESDEKALGGVAYSVNVVPLRPGTSVAPPLTEEEVEKLRAAGELSEEDTAKLLESNPELKSKPEWFYRLGFPLEKMHAPTRLRTEEASTTTEQLDMSPQGDDDEPKAKPSRKPTNKPAVAAKEADAVEDATDNNDDDDSSDDTMPEW